MPVPAASPRLAPHRAGVGLRAPHWHEIAHSRPPLGFLEVHPENHLSAGGAPSDILTALRVDYPFSFHATSFSLVSAEPLDAARLANLCALVDRIEPILISDHLAWSAWDGQGFPDLLPVPLHEETLKLASARVDEMQTALGRQILVENPSLYGRLTDSAIPEAEFLRELAARTGCGLLVDVNNIIVSAANLRFDPQTYLDALPFDAIGEVHVSGHAREQVAGRSGETNEIRIDDHGSAPPEPVWQLAAQLLKRTGIRPLLVEWDRNLPPLARLLAEATKADTLLATL